MSNPIENYECPDCGANDHSPVDGLCDTCIMKFYLQDVDAPTLPQIDVDGSGNKVLRDKNWITDDDSYGRGDVLLIDMSRWSTFDLELWDEADESDKWELAETISRKYGHASDSASEG